jgi:hypothetical protein
MMYLDCWRLNTDRNMVGGCAGRDPTQNGVFSRAPCVYTKAKVTSAGSDKSWPFAPKFSTGIKKK